MRPYPLILALLLVPAAQAQLIESVSVRDGLQISYRAEMSRAGYGESFKGDSPGILDGNATAAFGSSDGRGGWARSDAGALSTFSSGAFGNSATAKSVVTYSAWVKSRLDEDGEESGFLRYTVQATATSEVTVRLKKRALLSWAMFTERQYYGTVTSRSVFRNEQTGFSAVLDTNMGTKNGRQMVDPGLYTISTTTTIFDSLEIVGLIAGTGEANASMQFDDVAGAPVPEPTTMAALGLGAAALLRRRRTR